MQTPSLTEAFQKIELMMTNGQLQVIQNDVGKLGTMHGNLISLIKSIKQQLYDELKRASSSSSSTTSTTEATPFGNSTTASTMNGQNSSNYPQQALVWLATQESFLRDHEGEIAMLANQAKYLQHSCEDAIAKRQQLAQLPLLRPDEPGFHSSPSSSSPSPSSSSSSLLSSISSTAAMIKSRFSLPKSPSYNYPKRSSSSSLPSTGTTPGKLFPTIPTNTTINSSGGLVSPRDRQQAPPSRHSTIDEPWLSYSKMQTTSLRRWIPLGRALRVTPSILISLLQIWFICA